jgi:23S rRNA (uridine2479-2'-O)-methyltransferase
VHGVVVTGHAVDLYDPETVRATAGSFFSVPVVRQPSYKELVPWFDRLRQRFDALQILGTSAKAQMLIQDRDLTAPTILLIGNENHGLSESYRALCDAMVTIPMCGSATSLNVACAASILLYEVARQRAESSTAHASRRLLKAPDSIARSGTCSGTPGE